MKPAEFYFYKLTGQCKYLYFWST